MFDRPVALLRPVLAIVAVAVLASTALAQNPKLRLEGLERLEAKAAKTIDLTIDRELMGLAVKFLAHDNDADGKKVRDIIAGVQEIYVRGYEFETAGGYDAADVEAIRSQLSGPGWTRMTSVRSKKDGENAEIYIMHGGGKVLGLAILATDPKELTIVNIVGEIDPEKLSELDGEFGVPRIELKREVKTVVKTDPASNPKTAGR